MVLVIVTSLLLVTVDGVAVVAAADDASPTFPPPLVSALETPPRLESLKQRVKLLYKD